MTRLGVILLLFSVSAVLGIPAIKKPSRNQRLPRSNTPVEGQLNNTGPLPSEPFSPVEPTPEYPLIPKSGDDVGDADGPIEGSLDPAVAVPSEASILPESLPSESSKPSEQPALLDPVFTSTDSWDDAVEHSLSPAEPEKSNSSLDSSSPSVPAAPLPSDNQPSVLSSTELTLDLEPTLPSESQPSEVDSLLEPDAENTDYPDSLTGEEDIDTESATEEEDIDSGLPAGEPVYPESSSPEEEEPTTSEEESMPSEPSSTVIPDSPTSSEPSEEPPVHVKPSKPSPPSYPSPSSPSLPNTPSSTVKPAPSTPWKPSRPVPEYIDPSAPVGPILPTLPLPSIPNKPTTTVTPVLPAPSTPSQQPPVNGYPSQPLSPNYPSSPSNLPANIPANAPYYPSASHLPSNPSLASNGQGQPASSIPPTHGFPWYNQWPSAYPGMPYQHPMYPMNQPYPSYPPYGYPAYPYPGYYNPYYNAPPSAPSAAPPSAPAYPPTYPQFSPSTGYGWPATPTLLPPSSNYPAVQQPSTDLLPPKVEEKPQPVTTTTTTTTTTPTPTTTTTTTTTPTPTTTATTTTTTKKPRRAKSNFWEKKRQFWNSLIEKKHQTLDNFLKVLENVEQVGQKGTDVGKTSITTGIELGKAPFKILKDLSEMEYDY